MQARTIFNEYIYTHTRARVLTQTHTRTHARTHTQTYTHADSKKADSKLTD